jgi:lipopolysaccharide/colanic/teichoic acid biosynthesis glycosyltransferase
MERAFDILLSGVALLLLIPLLIPIGVILKLTGEGEVFFWQTRVGANKRIFKLLKFATMLKNSPSIGSGTVTVKNDPRVLPFGKYLRKSKVNELPQLVNVFRGDMSMIGPRPMTEQTFAYYSSHAQAKISLVRPGLSGVGSIIFRGEEDMLQASNDPLAVYADVIAPYKQAVEVWFVENRGLRLYWCCIFLTVWVVLFPKSTFHWSVLGDVPKPPESLRNPLNYLFTDHG